MDMGYLCLRGYLEVIVLRRLTEEHAKDAKRILMGPAVSIGTITQILTRQSNSYFWFFCHFSQGDNQRWPTKKAIEECKARGYQPTLLILKEGDHIHINKGRLYAFRTPSSNMLPETDCHYLLRSELLETIRELPDLSWGISWKWMNRGVTALGVHKEVSHSIDAALMNRKCGRRSLATPELSLLQMARELAPFEMKKRPLFGFFPSSTKLPSYQEEKQRRNLDTLRGLLPSLRSVVNEHIQVMQRTKASVSKSCQRGERISLSERPNAQENPETCPLDPYGNSGFLCKLCHKELSNPYFHCDGCEELLQLDFNICHKCHEEKTFMKFIGMHPHSNRVHSAVNHTGTWLTFSYVQSECPVR